MTIPINPKEYFPLYIGSKMMFEKSGRIATLLGVVCEPELMLNDGEDWRPYKYFPFKLLLRPINSMTEEEMKKLLIIVGVSAPHEIQWVNKEHVSKYTELEFLHYMGDEEKNGHLNLEWYSPEVFLFLLSKSFDLFGLIERGLALDSTKPETERK